MGYPTVVNEFETLKKVLEGYSIARFGDGEFNLARGGNCISQIALPALAEELKQVLRNDNPRCLVGVPTMDPKGPKIDRWGKYAQKYKQFLDTGTVYYSSFITRPDSAPWINTKNFFDDIESLWRDQRVALVGNGVRSIKPPFLVETGATEVVHVLNSYKDSYVQIDDLEQQVYDSGCQRAILCVGPTATCLAWRLSKKGVHAIDLGHIGLFWRRYALT